MESHVMAQRSLPTAGVSEGSQMLQRAGRYGDAYAEMKGDGLMAFTDEGTLFRAVSPTPGTGIAQNITAAFSATDGIFTLRNSDAAGRKRIYPVYVRLISTVVPASAVRSEALVAVDSITRYSSGGSALTARNVNMDSAVAAVGVAHFGALTLAAESGNVRRVSRFQLRAAIPVQFEEFMITFLGPYGYGALALGGTTAQRNVVDAGPVCLGPVNHTMSVHAWHPSNATTPASWEVEACWIER